MKCTTSPFNVSSTSVAADHLGNSVSVGGFGGTVDLGNGLVSNVEGYNAGSGRDIFIAKYNAQGGLIWVKSMGSSGNDAALGVAIDSQNNIIVVGGFHGTVDFGGVSLTSAGGFDIFVVKYSPSGGLLWAKRFGGAWEEVARAVAVDANDNIFLAATWQSLNA